MNRMSAPTRWYQRLLDLAELHGDHDQQQIARAVGVTNGTVTGWKHGTPPKPDWVIAFLESAKIFVDARDMAVMNLVMRQLSVRTAAQRRNEIMTITRGVAAAAMLAGLAIGAASTAWAETTLSGHYIRIETDPQTGQSANEDWYVTPCGDGCVLLASTPDGPAHSQAQLVNGQWTLDSTGGSVACPDGTVVPDAVSDHYTWDPKTLAGTVQVSYQVPACGHPAGYQDTNNIQLRHAP